MFSGVRPEIGSPVIRVLLLDIRAMDIDHSLLGVEILWVPLNSTVGYCVFQSKVPTLVALFVLRRTSCL